MLDPGSSSVSNNKHHGLIHLSVVDPPRSSVDSHESNEPLNSDKTAQDSSSFGPYDDQELQFRTDHHNNNMDVDESGPSSPTLWNNMELHSHQPPSRAQAIAKGQREMMEIVNNMPESSYELSLKDIVEHHHPIRLDDDEHVSQEEYLIQERNTYYDYRVQQEQHRAKKVIKRQVSVKAKMVRSGSVDNNRGLFLKMVFPFTWTHSHKKSAISSSSTTLPTKHVTLTKSTTHNSDDEVLEKSLMGRRRKMTANTIHKDLSTRRFSSSGTNSSSNGTNSSSSGSSNSGGSFKITNRRGALLNNYCCCFQSRKNKCGEYDT